jgi:serine/threonine protein kinase
LRDEVSFEGIRNRAAVDFLSKALEKDPVQRRNIHELHSDPFLGG